MDITEQPAPFVGDWTQRSTGHFDDDGRAIRGRWKTSSDGGPWELDIELTYIRA